MPETGVRQADSSTNVLQKDEMLRRVFERFPLLGAEGRAGRDKGRKQKEGFYWGGFGSESDLQSPGIPQVRVDSEGFKNFLKKLNYWREVSRRHESYVRGAQLILEYSGLETQQRKIFEKTLLLLKKQFEEDARPSIPKKEWLRAFNDFLYQLSLLIQDVYVSTGKKIARKTALDKIEKAAVSVSKKTSVKREFKELKDAEALAVWREDRGYIVSSSRDSDNWYCTQVSRPIIRLSKKQKENFADLITESEKTSPNYQQFPWFETLPEWEKKVVLAELEKATISEDDDWYFKSMPANFRKMPGMTNFREHVCWELDSEGAEVDCSTIFRGGAPMPIDIKDPEEAFRVTQENIRQIYETTFQANAEKFIAKWVPEGAASQSLRLPFLIQALVSPSKFPSIEQKMGIQDRQIVDYNEKALSDLCDEINREDSLTIQGHNIKIVPVATNHVINSFRKGVRHLAMHESENYLGNVQGLLSAVPDFLTMVTRLDARFKGEHPDDINGLITELRTHQSNLFTTDRVGSSGGSLLDVIDSLLLKFKNLSFENEKDQQKRKELLFLLHTVKENIMLHVEPKGVYADDRYQHIFKLRKKYKDKRHLELYKSALELNITEILGGDPFVHCKRGKDRTALALMFANAMRKHFLKTEHFASFTDNGPEEDLADAIARLKQCKKELKKTDDKSQKQGLREQIRKIKENIKERRKALKAFKKNKLFRGEEIPSEREKFIQTSLEFFLSNYHQRISDANAPGVDALQSLAENLPVDVKDYIKRHYPDVSKLLFQKSHEIAKLNTPSIFSSFWKKIVGKKLQRSEKSKLSSAFQLAKKEAEQWQHRKNTEEAAQGTTTALGATVGKDTAANPELSREHDGIREGGEAERQRWPKVSCDDSLESLMQKILTQIKSYYYEENTAVSKIETPKYLPETFNTWYPLWKQVSLIPYVSLEIELDKNDFDQIRQWQLLLNQRLDSLKGDEQTKGSFDDYEFRAIKSAQYFIKKLLLANRVTRYRRIILDEKKLSGADNGQWKMIKRDIGKSLTGKKYQLPDEVVAGARGALFKLMKSRPVLSNGIACR